MALFSFPSQPEDPSPSAPLSLKLAVTKEELEWAQCQVAVYHYLHRRVHVLSRPLAYLVLSGQRRVGCLLFARLQSTRCKGWYGNLSDVQCGWCSRSYWEVIGLSRVWLDPRVQRGGLWYIPNAASQMVAAALKRVGYDYLLAFPPPDPSEPFELKECVSYCQSDQFLCTLYLASSFKLVRENRHGLRTYARSLPGLQPHERKNILEASRLSVQARSHRQRRRVWPKQDRLLRQKPNRAA